MRVLGIDASLRSTGFAVLEGDRRKQRMVEMGLIKTRTGDSLEKTLGHIARSIEEIINRHKPEWLALEDVYTHKDTKSALLLGSVRGAVIVVCARKGLEVAKYHATRIKETVTGYGRADKQQVQNMVKRTLSLPEAPPHDAADAVAAALTHFLWHSDKEGRS